MHYLCARYVCWTVWNATVQRKRKEQVFVKRCCDRTLFFHRAAESHSPSFVFDFKECTQTPVLVSFQHDDSFSPIRFLSLVLSKSHIIIDSLSNPFYRQAINICSSQTVVMFLMTCKTEAITIWKRWLLANTKYFNFRNALRSTYL